MSKGAIVRTDGAVLEKASEGIMGARFRRLMECDDSFVKDRKAGDAEFLARLALCGADEEQIVRIWRASQRWDEEWCSNVHYVNDAVKLAVRTANHYQSRDKLKGNQDKLAQEYQQNEQFVKECKEATSPPAVEAQPKQPKPKEDKKPKEPEFIFRKASEIPPSVIRWYYRPWVFKGELTLLVGKRGTGKSSFTAWLVSQSKCAIVMPGTEGSIDGCVIPRLIANGVNMDRVYILESDGMTMPSRYGRLLYQMQALKADILLIDPLDDFLDPGICPNGEAVRPALQAFQRVAQKTNAAVIGVRNPGKNDENVVRNNTAWADIPRRIIQLVPGSGTPARNFLSCYKPGRGTPPKEQYYDLTAPDEEAAPTFTIGEQVGGNEADVALTVQDKLERKKIDVACDLIKVLLAEGEQDAGWCLMEGGKLGLRSGTMYLAATRLGVTYHSEGGGKSATHRWIPPDTWPDGSPVGVPPSVFPATPPPAE